MRALFLIHRYLGIGIGLLMACWCLSGIVMMYAPYPYLSQENRFAGLAPIEWQRVRTLAGGGLLADDVLIDRFELEMFAGSPLLRLTLTDGGAQAIDLATNSPMREIASKQAIAAATTYALGHGLVSTGAIEAESIQFDQWTVGGFRGDRPLYRVALRDSAGSEVYVSSHTGKIVQATTRARRFLGWIGAVPHWLYPSMLRQNAALWTQVVVYASLLGIFLTAIGLFIGIRQLRWRNKTAAPRSPYRGVMLWHHVPGLIFGVLTLTWVTSGMLSMNPWGLMEGGDVMADRQRLMGASPSFREIRQLIEAMRVRALPEIQSIESAPLDGGLFVVATFGDGSRARFDAGAMARPITTDEINGAAKRIGGANATWEIIREPDRYHYSLLEQRAMLPAVRIISPGTNYYYLDALSGKLINEADAGSKAYRWWHSGLHRLDFSPLSRTQMFRNLVMLPLLLGAALVAGTGAFIGLRRIWPKALRR
jgi:uncharacterized iron-regulated membrane protein